MKTKLLIEQHFHGAFGVDFNVADVEEIRMLAREMLKYGVGGFFPTIVTDSLENAKKAVSNIKAAAALQTPEMSKILGIHLEGLFLNPEKAGIHDASQFLPLTVDNYKLIEDDFIKIVTLAPELDEGLIEYLNCKGVKVQAGHCVGANLAGCSGVTHLFNAMGGIVHRGKSTALSALVDDEIYTEVIADGVHVSHDALKLIFNAKPIGKILLISDCLPITHSEKTEMLFCGESIFYDGYRAMSKDGTLAGSTVLQPEMLKRLLKSSLISEDMAVKLINNFYDYHCIDIDIDGFVEWDDDYNIVKVEKL